MHIYFTDPHSGIPRSLKINQTRIYKYMTTASKQYKKIFLNKNILVLKVC